MDTGEYVVICIPASVEKNGAGLQEKKVDRSGKVDSDDENDAQLYTYEPIIKQFTQNGTTNNKG